MLSNARIIDSAPLEESAFHRAAKTGNCLLLECFLKAGANVNLQTKRSDAPLYLSAQSSNLEAVALLLQNGADPNMKNSGGNAALHSAAQHGNYNLAKLLVSYNANLRIKNERMQFPFHIAVKGNHAPLLDLFLESDPGAALLKDLNGKTALEYCKNPESKNAFTRYISWKERKGILFVHKFSKEFEKFPNGAIRMIVDFI